MTGEEIKAFFENLIDDSLDDDFTYELMNNAKNEIEMDPERNWEFLKKTDSANTTVVGRTYSTGYNLPLDFGQILSVFKGTKQLNKCNFEDQILYKNNGSWFFLDLRTGKVHVCGTETEALTLYIHYLYLTDDITAVTSPVWPARFHKLIAFKMAELFQEGIDADDITFKMSPQQRARAKVLYDGMAMWDMHLKLAGINQPDPGASNFSGFSIED